MPNTAKQPSTKGLKVEEIKATLPHVFHVTNENDFTYVVRVQPHGKGWTFYCQCPDHAYRSAPGKPRLCRHILAVLKRKSMKDVRDRVGV